MSYVLDASAAIAVLLDEPGADKVAPVIAQASISAVNLSEAINAFARRGVDIEAAHDVLMGLEFDVVAFDAGLALSAALLQPATASAGLSLGDRACLALAKRLGVPALTADRAWATIAEAAAVEIVLIR